MSGGNLTPLANIVNNTVILDFSEPKVLTFIFFSPILAIVFLQKIQTI